MKDQKNVSEKEAVWNATMILVGLFLGIFGAVVFIYIMLGEPGTNEGILFTRDRYCQDHPEMRFIVLGSDNAYTYSCDPNGTITWELTDGTVLSGKTWYTGDSAKAELYFSFAQIAEGNKITEMQNCYLRSAYEGVPLLPITSPQIVNLYDESQSIICYGDDQNLGIQVYVRFPDEH